MSLRHLFLHNWRWKLFSLLLATAIWFFVDASLRNDVVVRKNPLSSRADFQGHVKVGVFSSGNLSTPLRVEPAGVDVTVRGDFVALQDLDWKQIRAFVDVSSLGTNGNSAALFFERLVEVRGPANVEVIRVEPVIVTVRRVAPIAQDKRPAPSENP